jgi:hypothetical protein
VASATSLSRAIATTSAVHRGAYLRIHDGVTLELFERPPSVAS